MSRGTELDVRRDVCVSLSCDNKDRVRLHALSKVDPSKVERKIAGLTALLQVQHGKSHDWSNYAHLTSACLLLATAAELELRRRPVLAARLLKWASAGLHVAMPQVTGDRLSCGHPRIPALQARGALSEVFAMVAMAATSSVLSAAAEIAGGSHATANASALGTESLLLCNDVARRSKGGFTCFDALVRIPERRANNQAELEAVASSLPTAAGMRIGARMQRAAHELLGLTRPKPPRHRRVVLLTRRSQSVWVNRAAAAARIRGLVRHAHGSFVDAGEAEDLGRDGAGCFRAAPQVRLWASAWLVVTVVGAHESNLVHMPQSGAGVLETLNCGHRSATYSSFAKVAGVAHTASHELKQQGHAWLRSARAPLLQQACAHIGGTGNRGVPPERCSVGALLARLPRLYERKRCASNLSATRGIYFNMPRVVRLSGEDLDLMKTLRDLLVFGNPPDETGLSSTALL